MSQIGLAIAFGLFAWWFSTGLIIILVRLPRRFHLLVMGAISVLALLGFVGLGATAANTSVAGAFAGFAYALLVWAWIETSFLMGYVTGPRRVPQDLATRGWLRFRAAFDTVSAHEIAIVLAGAAMLWISWGAQNNVGLWTFLVLWAMRVSAKLNLFLGVPNVSGDLLPGHLTYLASYFQQRRVSLFFPVSVTLASLAFGVLAHAAATAADPFTGVALTLVATLLALAIVEHWFLVLPIRDSTLWRWALKAVDVGRISDDIAPPIEGALPHRPANSPIAAEDKAASAPRRDVVERALAPALIPSGGKP